MKYNVWNTEGFPELVRKLFDEGVAYYDMAERLGCSRNSIIGYAHRHGWPMRIKLQTKERKEENKRRISQGLQPIDWRVHSKRSREVPTPPKPIAYRPIYSPCKTCQWTDSADPPYLWCGAPVLRGKSYCKQHYHICFFPAPPIKFSGKIMR